MLRTLRAAYSRLQSRRNSRNRGQSHKPLVSRVTLTGTSDNEEVCLWSVSWSRGWIKKFKCMLTKKKTKNLHTHIYMYTCIHPSKYTYLIMTTQLTLHWYFVLLKIAPCSYLIILYFFSALHTTVINPGQHMDASKKMDGLPYVMSVFYI